MDQSINSRSPGEDLYILSDLHLSEGLSGDGRRFSRLETFFFDQEFANLVGAILKETEDRGTRARIIFKRRYFRLFGCKAFAPPRMSLLRKRVFLTKNANTDWEQLLKKSAWKMRSIVRGHKEFFRALLQFMDVGFGVTLIRGNHDVELFWPEVQKALVEEN